MCFLKKISAPILATAIGLCTVAIVGTCIIVTNSNNNKTTTEDKKEIVSNSTEVGSTLNNISNDGLIVKKEDHIYHALYNNDINRDNDIKGLYKTNKDMTESKCLVSGKDIYTINVVGDWIYFRADSDIAKVKTDGTEYTVLKYNLNTNNAFLNVIGDWMYFDNESITKMKVDGTEEKKLNNDTDYKHGINVVGDWIYYGTKKGITKIKIDGTEEKKIFDGEVECMIVYEDNIYFNNNGIKKMKTDGSNLTTIVSDRVSEFNIDNAWIYYQDMNTNGNTMPIYKIKIDGTEKTKLAEVESRIDNFNILDNCMYFKLYKSRIKMKTDGTEKIVLVENLDSKK